MSRYDWDLRKARINVRKHGVSFDEAADVLDADRSEERPDLRHSVGENRVRTIGSTLTGKVIVVITSTEGPRPRIISAWRATKRERDAYVG